MRTSHLSSASGFIVISAGFAAPLPAFAGMPSVSLTDAAALRIDAISFFLAGLALSAAGVRFLWNVVQRDVAWLPRLTYGKSVSVVLLWGLVFVLVLTMISGARELMTPGAWEKNGLTYRLAENRGRDSVQTDQESVNKTDESSRKKETKKREAALERLWNVLLNYAIDHKGQFPSQEGFDSLPLELRELPEFPGLPYRYLAGRTAKDSNAVIAYEPEVFNGERFVLSANGQIRSMPADVLDSLVTGVSLP